LKAFVAGGGGRRGGESALIGTRKISLKLLTPRDRRTKLFMGVIIFSP
jgi:hypothetical protein